MSVQTENNYAIYHDITIKGSVESIYQAITVPEHLNNWWTLKSSGEPSEGTAYNFYFSPEYDWYGNVIKATQNQDFHIKMTKSDADWTPTSFGFDLEKTNAGVLLKFWHVGWQQCNEHFRRSSFCWAMLLNGLKNYVEKGVIIPFENRE
ncbi:SRPBCC domain-containing protein [Flavobacteriaceae bacterium R38]|nr:SRPBCC domain-containing protein [Flavobacteriaceae bacterium R38]